MQTDLHYTRCTSRHAATRNRVSLNCERLEGRDAPSASPLAAPVTSALASSVHAAAATPASVSTSASHNVFALGGAAVENSPVLSDAAHAQALQSHAAAVLQDFATPAAAVSNVAKHVAARTTTTTLSVSTHSATVGQKVTLTATVAALGSSAKPGGTVTFKDGNTVVGKATLNAHGVAQLTTTLAAGTHHLTAVYGGDAHDKYSTSSAATVTVTAPPKPATQVKIENVGDVKSAGVPLVLETTVKGGKGGVITIVDGSKLLGQIEIDRTGHAALAINFGLSAGHHTLTAVYQSGAVHASGSVSFTLTPLATPMW